MNKNKIILDLCGGTGGWSKPYKDAGYDVRIITLPHHDVRTFKVPKNVYGILAAPPCTEFSIAKNHKILRDFKGGMEIVQACLDIIEKAKPKFYAIENPVGFLRDFIGDPIYSFQPWHFGSPWSKRTFLWGNFNHPVKTHSDWKDVKKIPELYIRPNRGKPSIAFLHKSAQKYIPELKGFIAIDDASFRAITPQGFAKAFFKANR